MKSVARTIVLCVSVVAAAFHVGCGGGGTQTPPPPMLKITTGSLPNGITGNAYDQTIQAVGGVGPFQWTVSAGTLPHNLSLGSSTANSVAISGTPDAGAQGVTFTLRVTDSSNQSATQGYTVSVLLGSDNLTMTPPAIDFGTQAVGSASAHQTEILSNAGGSPLALNSIGITGPNAADFSQGSVTCGSTLAAGGDCQIDLNFKPLDPGPRVAALTITDDNVGSPQSIAVNGTGLTAGPNATLSATRLSFNDQVLDTKSSALSITVSNYGTAPLNIASVATTANFEQTNDCATDLASGASCTVNVTFTPTATGSVFGTLTIADGAPGSPHTVSLSGNGVAGQCGIEGRQCSSTKPCCPGLKCVFHGGSTRGGYACSLP